MNPLSPPDSARLLAAQEFLRRGQPAEAGRELEPLLSEHGEHPEILEMRWEILAQGARWDLALDAAQSLRRVAPDNHLAWMYLACSLTELGRHPEALEALVAAAEKFPDIPTIPYNLACCACKLGRFKEASAWLGKAIQIGGRAEIKLLALDDPDLAPLLDEVCAL